MTSVTNTEIRLDMDAEDDTQAAKGPQTIFNVDDITRITANVTLINKLTVPPDIPDVDNVKASEIPNLLARCQETVKQWDNGIKGQPSLQVQMSKLASDVNQFANDQITAKSYLNSLNDQIDNAKQASPQEKAALIKNISGTFDYIKGMCDTYQRRAADIAGKIDAFKKQVDSDKQSKSCASETARVRGLYEGPIAVQRAEIEQWEKAHGLKPGGDLVKDLEKARDDLNDRISADNDKLAGFGTETGVGCVIFILTFSTGVGALVGGALIGTGSWQIDEARHDRADAETELDGAVQQLEKANRLATLEHWFSLHKSFFDDLSNSLSQIKKHAETLASSWQTLSNKFDGLSMAGGALDQVKSGTKDFTDTVAPFALLSQKNAFEAIAKATLVLQKTAFVTPTVMDYKQDFAREARKQAA